MTDWKKAPVQFASSFLKGKVAAMEGKDKKKWCPFDNIKGSMGGRHYEAWMAGFDSVAPRKVKVKA